MSSSPQQQPPHPPAEKVGGMRVKAPSRPSGKEPSDDQPLITKGACACAVRKTLTRADPSQAQPLAAHEHRVSAVEMDGAQRPPLSNPSQRHATPYIAPPAHQPGRPKHDPHNHLFQPSGNRQ